MVSRDIYFDEEKQWSWNDIVGAKETEQGPFELELITLKGTDDYSENENGEEEVMEEEENGNDEEEHIELRRSYRVTTKPSHLDDYILLADIEFERLLW